MPDRDSDIELFLDARALIGDLASRQTITWALPSDIGGYALTGAGALVALRSGIFALDFASGSLEQICNPPFAPSTHRFNESGCDASGRLWLGTMFDPAPGVQADPGPIISTPSPSPAALSVMRTGASCTTASHGAPGEKNSSLLSRAKSGSTTVNTIWREARSARKAALQTCPANAAFPTGVRSTRKAATGAPSMAAGGCIAAHRTAASMT